MQEDSQAAPVFVFSPSKYADICYGCFTRVVRRRCSCRKNLSYAEKQRARGAGHGVVVQRIVTMQWLSCAMKLLQPSKQLSRLTCGCQPFSCRCSQNVTDCRKEICSTCLFKESIPTIPLENSKHPLPARSLSFLRAAYVPPSLH